MGFSWLQGDYTGLDPRLDPKRDSAQVEFSHAVVTDCVIALANLENVEDGVEEGEELLADGGFADEDGKEPQRDVQVLLEGSIFYFGSIFGINYLINIQHTCIKNCWGRAKMSMLIPHYH